MSSEEIKKILQRLDNLEDTLLQQATDLELVATNNRRGVKADAKQQSTFKHAEPKQQIDVSMFPEAVRKYVQVYIITNDDRFYNVKMQYIHDKETYKTVADAWKHIGGNFVSAGKDSFWEVPKQ